MYEFDRQNKRLIRVHYRGMTLFYLEFSAGTWWITRWRIGKDMVITEIDLKQIDDYLIKMGLV